MLVGLQRGGRELEHDCGSHGGGDDWFERKTRRGLTLRGDGPDPNMLHTLVGACRLESVLDVCDSPGLSLDASLLLIRHPDPGTAPHSWGRRRGREASLVRALLNLPLRVINDNTSAFESRHRDAVDLPEGRDKEH